MGEVPGLVGERADHFGFCRSEFAGRRAIANAADVGEMSERDGRRRIEHHLIEEEHKFFQEAGKVLTETQKTALAKEYETEFTTLRVKEG